MNLLEDLLVAEKKPIHASPGGEVGWGQKLTGV